MKLKLKKTFTNFLITRYRVVIRNEEDLAEKSTFSFSYAKLITLSFFTLLLFISLSLVLSHTFLRKWLNPAYIDQENRNRLMQLSAKLEQLEEKNAQQDNFIKLFQNMVEGKREATYAVDDFVPEQVKDNLLKLDTNVNLEPADIASNLALPDTEAEMNHSYIAATSYHVTAHLPDLFLFTPLEGIITTPFDAKIEHYGLDVVGKENDAIKCIADGTVILATWTVETGWVMVVQHSKDLLSIYKHNATLFKKTGNFVRAGEVIAVMGNSGEFSTGPHLHFELWYDGNAVNPEDFIAF